MAALQTGKAASRLYNLSHVAVLCSLFVLDRIGAASPSPDTHALHSFQASADPALQSLNWSAGDPCSGHWIGVSCDEGGHVHELVLEGLQLKGTINMLSSLSEIRLLSLKDNAFNGSLPDMSQWRYLRHLYLQNNKFSGFIPESIAEMTRLLRFTVSGNQLSGTIPPVISKLTYLTTLRLEDNQLSGPIPPLQLVNLSDFNVSYNHLIGSIPSSLERFGPSAFQGNSMLCGRPLFPGLICDDSMPRTFPSSQSTDPGLTIDKKKSGLSRGAIIAIAMGDAVIFLLIGILSVAYYCQRYSHRHVNEKILKKREKMIISMTQCDPTKVPKSERCKLVVLKDSDQLKLGDLLGASAEMLGKGIFGTTYKAVLEHGTTVTVKRMKEVISSSKKEFDQKIEAIGKLGHPNVLPLRAYYFAKEEKLLVYDYQPNGSLHFHLHGRRGPGGTPLDWMTRVRIAVGVAKALTHLHHVCGKEKITHGNIKSSNILLDANYNPLLADFGLALIINPIAAISRAADYRAPELSNSKRTSQPADVYSFGVVLLELLTRKAPATFYPLEDGMDLPKWVKSVVREEWTSEVFDIELLKYKNIEEDMVSMLQTALLCTEPLPEHRPKMDAVLALLEKLYISDQSPFYDNTNVCQFRSVSEDLTATS